MKDTTLFLLCLGKILRYLWHLQYLTLSVTIFSMKERKLSLSVTIFSLSVTIYKLQRTAGSFYP